MTDPVADVPDRPVRIAVITKLANFNAGNEALSWCLLDFLQSKLDRAEFRLIDRTWPLSRGLNAYTARQLREQPAKVPERFAAMVDDFIRRFGGRAKGKLAPVGGSANVSRPPSPSGTPRVLARLAGALRIRSRLIAAGLLRSPEVQRAYNTLEWADVLVWNAAAEIYPTAEWDDVLRLMILFVAARRLGAQVVIVNHSMETSDPALDRVIGRVYASASLVYVRGARSLAKARSLGTAKKKLVEAPDLAFLATRATPEVGMSRWCRRGRSYLLSTASLHNATFRVGMSWLPTSRTLVGLCSS